MITEDYVSFETAKLLKEKGFDEPCYCAYKIITKPSVTHYQDKVTNSDLNSVYTNIEFGSLPTLQMAMKWLEEVHHILVIPDYIYECTDTSWVYKIYRLGENGKPERNAIIGTSYDSNGYPTLHTIGYRDYDMSKQEYATRREALEEGIKYCLENLI